ncbi:MAG: HflC/HflK family protein [Candidatus Magasanikbacteria bacterium GW2011_GWA2_45_39]|nr:MAG: HflC/HflK family protein [Candidatus Magasanikbacteria bacterium GW2011_GWA2_45_39]
MYSFVVEDVLKGLFIYVPPGYVACVYDLGRGVLKKVLSPGLHLKIPFWQKAKLFNTQTLEYSISKNFNPENEKALGDSPVSAQTLDAKKIALEGTMLLRLDVHQIPAIWQTIGEDFVIKIVRPTIRSRVRMVVSRYNYQDLISGHRDRIEVEIKNELERIFYPRGIYVENVLLSEIDSVVGKVAVKEE